MGARGPKPTPTAQLAARGNPHAAARLRQGTEPTGDHEPPACPDWLCDEARACWEYHVPLLGAMGMLERVDGNALARYCHLWARWRRLEATIAEKGEVYESTSNTGSMYAAVRPEVGIANKLATLLDKLEGAIGLNPGARTRINVTPPPKPAEKPKPAAVPTLKIAN